MIYDTRAQRDWMQELSRVTQNEAYLPPASQKCG